MLIKSVTSLVVAIVIAFAGQAHAQSLNGTWSVSNGTMAGKAVPSSVLSSMSLMINGSVFEAKSGGFVSKGALGANTLAVPPQMEFTINDGADKGRKIKAIYEFAGRDLKIAFSESGQYPNSMSGDALVLTYKLNGAASSVAATPAPASSSTSASASATTGIINSGDPMMAPKRKKVRRSFSSQ